MAGDDRIVGVLLAAGFGRRFGADKRLLALADGEPMAGVAARNLRATCAQVVAVVRPGDDALAARLQGIGCSVVFCHDAERGMGHSLASGVAAAPDASGWLIALADMPAIRPASYQAVIDALQRGACVARTSFERSPGHPVGFDRSWYLKLSALTGDVGARHLIRDAGDQCVMCAVNDPGVVFDVDTRADWSVKGGG